MRRDQRPSNCKPDRLVNNAPSTEKPFSTCEYPIAITSWMMLIVDKMTLILVGVRLIVYVQTRFVLITSPKEIATCLVRMPLARLHPHSSKYSGKRALCYSIYARISA